MPITPTHINYYHVCHRKLWLFHHGVRMEGGSEQVYEGKLTGELSYPERAAKYTELELPGARIDYYDPASRTVHEVKHSNKVEKAHIAQVKYYLYLLERAGIPEPKGLLEYPRLKKREAVIWKKDDRAQVEQWVDKVEAIVALDTPPEVINHRICKSCSYYDFCYTE